MDMRTTNGTSTSLSETFTLDLDDVVPALKIRLMRQVLLNRAENTRVNPRLKIEKGKRVSDATER